MYGFYIIFICGKFLHYFTVVLLNSFNYIEYCIVYKKYYMNVSVCVCVVCSIHNNMHRICSANKAEAKLQQQQRTK